MKSLKFMGILALAVSFVAPAFAETQTVKVSGSLDAYWAYRENFDLREGNDVGLVPMTAASVPSSPSVGNRGRQDDAADFFFSVVQLEVAADLTDNVSVVVNLFNQRDWNATSFDFDATNGFATAQDDEFDIGIDLAYVQLKEAFYRPLTLTIGRQDIEFGRGFILGNWNIQDPNSSITLDEYSAVTSFDAIRATLDFNPWTVDLVTINVRQAGVNAEDDRYVHWANVNYQFAEYNAEWEAYAGLDHDRVGDTTAGLFTGSVNRSAATNETYVVGTRAQFDPVEQMTLGAEGAYQMGDRFATNATGIAAGVNSQDRSAWAFDLFAEYRWSDHAYTPWVGAEWVYLSGDEEPLSTGGDFEGWNGFFRSPTYGNIREWLETYYQTALTGDGSASNNHMHLALSGGLAPMEDLSIDGTFYFFLTDEDVINSTGGVSQNVGDDLGTELDVNITYDYTEDVTFGLGLAWFFPGDVYDNASAGGGNPGPLDDTATSVTSKVSVAF